MKSDSKPSPTSQSSDKDDGKKEKPKSTCDDKKKESEGEGEGEGESDEMALVNSYLHASQNINQTKKQPKKTVEVRSALVCQSASESCD